MTGDGAGRAAAPLDPFQMWRQFYEINEQAWTRAIKEMVGNWDYAGAQGKMLESFLSVQKMMMEEVSTQWKNLNVPTRDDVYRIGEVVVGVEEKVDQMDDRVGGVGDRLAAVEGRLDQLDHRFGALADRSSGSEGKVAQLEPRLAALGQDLAGVEGKLPQLDHRLAAMEERLRGLEKKQETGIEELDRRLQELDRRLVSLSKSGEAAQKSEEVSEPSPGRSARPRPATRRTTPAGKPQ